MTKERLSQGLIQVYTGDGKGKTTCALGLAFRAVGQGYKVYMIQFMKGRDTGELAAAGRLAPDLTIRSFGRPGLVNYAARRLKTWPWCGRPGTWPGKSWPRASTTW